MFDQSTAGLTIHRRWMHYELDPRSQKYLQDRRTAEDAIDEEAAYRFPTHRLPLHSDARHAFLWAPLRPFARFQKVSGREIAERLVASIDVLVKETEELMLS
jgi:hypothetical protein